ncbi:MAG: Repeat protein, partial [Bacteroidetes bacterium]|nr:Repeat protein [Bacteroidota bacterium]
VTPDAAANFGYRIADDAITLTDAVILSVNFYDNYGFMSPDEYTGSTYFSSPLLSYNAENDFDNRYYTDHAEGLPTGTLTAELDGGVVRGYLPSVSYYDYRGNVVQRKSGSQLTEGFEKEYFANNFTGAPLKRKHVHTATGQGTQTEVYSYRYDHKGRLLEVNHQLNSNPAVNLLSNRYDALGRLKSTSGHDQAGLQTDYTYNVRSWVKGISNPSFKEDLSYSYNGNISSQQWQQDGKNRKYTFDYDALSRLKQAAYTGDGAYGTAYAYDKMGNITGLQRYDGTMIDNLTMTYQGNRLIKTDDATNDTKGFTDGVKVAKEYFYDENGNLTEDLNKNITAIQYNYLNLPSKIIFGDGSTIAYLYGADGTKLRTTHTINGTVTTTDYCGNVIYENGTATRLLTEAGYVSLNDNKYHYYLHDHQGNNRVVVNQSGTVEETNHYYPFGSVFANTNNVQPYKYNGKEFDSKKGLNWHDYGARFYDAALGRFMTVDPLCEKYYSISPYVYCLNNPVRFIDVDGRIPTVAEAAAMAAHVYGDKTNGILTGGWQVSNRNFGIKMNTESGLQSQVYQRTVDGKTEYTYATAGTQDWTDAGQDVAQVVGLSKQYSESVGNAKAINQDLGKSNQELTFVGHSLGGGEAALNALVTNNNAITFNAAGVSNITKVAAGGLMLPFKSESKINAVVMLTDPLNAAQKNLGLPVANGRRTTIYPTDLKSVINGHSMDNVLKNYKIDPNKYIKPAGQ